MTEKDIKALLDNKYASPAYAFFTNVGNGTGSLSGRYIDGVAYALYPSLGHEIIGFEIKVSRSDFLSEMKNPRKSDESMRYCHRWFLVAPQGIAAKEELPKSWGFIEVRGDKLFTKRPAPLLKPEHSPSFAEDILKEYRQKISAFEEASGIDTESFLPWGNPKEVGEAVKFVRGGGIAREIKNVDNDFDTAIDHLKEVIHSIEKIKKCAIIKPISNRQ